MALTQEQKMRYYKNRGRVAHKVIVANVKKKGHVIYGARALNAHFPPALDRHTEDFDVFTKTPKKTAVRVEKKLDKHYGGDFFYTEQAKHKDTWKVKSHVTKKGVADYTKPENKITHKVIRGKRYVALAWVKKHIRKTLKDPEAKFRHEKDKEALQRIKLHEEMQRRKMQRKRKPRRRAIIQAVWPRWPVNI